MRQPRRPRYITVVYSLKQLEGVPPPGVKIEHNQSTVLQPILEVAPSLSDYLAPSVLSKIHRKTDLYMCWCLCSNTVNVVVLLLCKSAHICAFLCSYVLEVVQYVVI